MVHQVACISVLLVTDDGTKIKRVNESLQRGWGEMEKENRGTASEKTLK